MNDVDTCFIYMICHKSGDRLAGPVKVGITGQLSARLAQVQTGNPYPLELAIYLPMPDRSVAGLFEGGFHQVMAAHRMKGEWFDLTPPLALAALLANVRSGLQHFIGDDPDLFDLAVKHCRLAEAEDLLKEIMANG
jgi:hypothetical protein